MSHARLTAFPSAANNQLAAAPVTKLILGPEGGANVVVAMANVGCRAAAAWRL